MTAEERMMRALNIVTKWRVLFTGWQLGTRAKGNPEADAVRDHRELSILLRVEVNALTRLLLEKFHFTQEELQAAIAEEADGLSEMYAHKFPGVRATEEGLSIDTTQAMPWMMHWRP